MDLISETYTHPGKKIQKSHIERLNLASVGVKLVI
jgi:hypothetical protein